MIETITEFHRETHALFPDIAQRADREYARYWDDGLPQTELACYSWFESVANALNREMRDTAFLSHSTRFFKYVHSVLMQSGDDVRRCIDVALVENLFWQVPAEKARPYWEALPASLKALYLGFHWKAPVERKSGK